ncbi:MAG: hypothetical protein JRH20_28125, partial [Deltaproteobacteria bacterium]|nr:hypothetical protein [Deltaproteobacteria bacterium]
LLAIDELRAQPGMLKDLREIAPAQKIIKVLGEVAPVLGPVGHEDLLLNTAGLVRRLAQGLGPQPVDLEDGLTRWEQSLSDDDSNYAAHCRSAIVYLAWKNFTTAEAAINRAKFKHDNWALAHYVYGLLRGMQGDAGRAHFELYLAFHREPYPEGQARIKRALDLVR